MLPERLWIVIDHLQERAARTWLWRGVLNPLITDAVRRVLPRGYASIFSTPPQEQPPTDQPPPAPERD